MTDRILVRIAVTVYRYVHGIAPDYLSELCSHPASHTAHHLDTVPDPSTETSLAVPPVKPTLRTADDVLVYLAQPFGTAACRTISDTLELLYLSAFFGAT